MFKLIGTVLAVAENTITKTANIVDTIGDTALISANAANILAEDKLTLLIAESEAETSQKINALGVKPRNLRARTTLAERLEESKVPARGNKSS